jgi:hypothetical protein
MGSTWGNTTALNKSGCKEGGEEMAKFSRKQRENYATKLTLISVFISFLAAFTSRLSLWKRTSEPEELKPFDLALLGLATMRLGRMIAYDHIAEPLREPFAQTVPDQTGAVDTVEPRPSSSGVRQSFGELLSCPICVGTWVAAGLVYGLHAIPRVTRVFISIMGTIGLAEVLNAVTETLTWTGSLARKMTGQKD